MLDSQRETFKTFVQAFGEQYKDWLSLTPFNGVEADRSIAAGWISGAGPVVGADRVSIATGGHHACLIALVAARLQGKAVAVEDLSYPSFADIAKMVGVTLIPCATDAYGLIPSALKAATEQYDIKAVYLMPTVHNPTGRVMPVSRREEIISVARFYGQIIIDDDAYGFLEDHTPLNFAQLAPDLGWYIASMSKPLAPDIKVAYVVSPEGSQAAVNDAIRLTTSNPSSFFTGLVSAMITRGDLQRTIAEKRTEGYRRQAAVREQLKNFTITAHPNSWHLWVKLPAGTTAMDMERTLVAAGVGVLPGIWFSGTPAVGNDHIRVALGCEPDEARVTRGIEIIRQCFEKERQGL